MSIPTHYVYQRPMRPDTILTCKSCGRQWEPAMWFDECCGGWNLDDDQRCPECFEFHDGKEEVLA